jgi:hypothetical protein
MQKRDFIIRIYRPAQGKSVTALFSKDTIERSPKDQPFLINNIIAMMTSFIQKKMKIATKMKQRRQ